MTRAEISAIINQMSRNDNLCQGASQQMVNGFFRIFEILELIAHELDEDGNYYSEIVSIRNTLERNEIYSQSAPQQCANGCYRLVELLGVLVRILDKRHYTDEEVAKIIRDMEKNELYCQSSPQQIANGAYRMASMTAVLLRTVSFDLVKGALNVLSAMDRAELMCQGAPQQSANGTDAVAAMASILVSHLDTEGKYATALSSILSAMRRNNDRCEGADQQSANHLYRIVEMLQIITEIIIEKKIEDYWSEHEEQREVMLQEIVEHQAIIRQIQYKADCVNADNEIAPIQQEINILTTRMNAVGAEELKALDKELAARRAEKSAIGIFKFADRRAASEKIEEALQRFKEKQQEVNKQKAVINKEIEAKKNQIARIERRVQEEKDEILQECNWHQEVISGLRYELTRER